ncbi:hypothetical protein EAE96_010367 [Botrytis aclada]|nr:hypothetical protein EAE96_010367 [Botrytis aclada]
MIQTMASHRIVFLLIHLFCTSSAQAVQNINCRALPGDQSWPSAAEWINLNNTVNGRLIATVPIASPCHDPSYNETECAYLQANWANPSLHWNSSSSSIAPYFATLGNQSCDPFSSEQSPCRLGNLVNYVVNVSISNDAVAAVLFAKNHNIRFVIRNTGHEMYHFLTGNPDYFTGKAMRIGAGIQGFEALEAAHDAGFVTVGGECPTVGIAGGYTQGGGHSALSSNFGMGADQALSWEVVTAGGDVVTASRTENKDLYWALSGGGGGTYGVIISLTVRVYPDTIVSGASLAFSATGDNKSIETFWDGVEAFHTYLPGMIDAGTMIGYGASSSVFRLIGMTSYNKTKADVQALLANFTNKLTTLGINFTVAYTQSPTYLDHYNQSLGPLPYGPWVGSGVNTGGGRLISRSVVQENNKAYVATIRNVTNAGIPYTGVALNVSSSSITSTADNALLPAWRDALIHVILTTPWNYSAPISEMLAAQYHMINEIIPQFEVLTPGGGAYLNEANFRQPDWQQTFYGKNYRKLLGIKNK